MAVVVVSSWGMAARGVLAMDISVFDVYQESPYTFLQVKRGTVIGDYVESSVETTGVFKLRTGFTKGDTQETAESDATLHIHPLETFITANNGNLVGHGIVSQGRSYEIVGMTGGDNFHTGVREHITLNLQIAEFEYAS